MANSAPVLSGLGDVSSFTENGSSVRLDADQNASVSDTELDASVNKYAGATLTLARTGAANPDDTFVGGGSLDLTDSNGLGENVSLDGGATFIGTFSQPDDGTFSITFNANAGAAEINSVMHQIFYANASDNPPGSVQIDFIFSDGNGQPGGQSQGTGATPGTATGSVTVNITQIDDAPVLLNVAPTAAYSAGSSGVVLSPALNVADVDATAPSTLTGVASATIKIESGFLATDQLFVNLTTSGGHFVTPDSDVTNISVLSNAGGTLVLSGNDTVAHYQSVLDAMSYRSTAADPSNGGADPSRNISWQVNDGLLNSQTPNPDPNNLVNETILHFNAPPTLDLDASGAGTGFTTTFTERTAPVAMVDTDVLITDLGNAALSSATIVLTDAKASDVMSIAGTLPGGIDSSIDTSVAGQITIHLFNSASLADYQTALGDIRFANTSVVPDTTDRDITVTVNDGDADSNLAHATVHVVNVPNSGTDFNADGHSDILLQNVKSGSAFIWEMNGTGLTGNGGVGWTPGAAWQVKDEGDYNGDGYADVLLQNVNTGDAYIWELNGTSLVGNGAAGWTPGAAWQAKQGGDFNGDGNTDILLQNVNTGAAFIWEMNGTSLIGNGSVGWTPGAAWQAKATGDFNGDGKSDIALQNVNTGDVYIWELDGTSLVGNGSVGWTPGAAWQVKAAGDYNGDGKSDILLQNANTGDVYIWELNGTSLIGNGPAGWTPGPAWQAKDGGDYNGDGKSDILLQNVNTGDAYMWLMNGTSLIGASPVGWTPGPDWHIS